MLRLRVVYSSYRIGLFALALGLAFVWMIPVTTMNPEAVDVQLPVVQSSNILPVFVETSRFVNKSGGSGPDRGGVWLSRRDSHDDSKLSFHLNNYGDETVYLPRLKPKTSRTTVPYFLECQDGRGAPIYVIPTAFEFDRNPVRLNPEQHLTLTVTPPSTARSCVIVVAFTGTKGAALDMAARNPFSSMRETSFLDSVSDWSWVAWGASIDD